MYVKKNLPDKKQGRKGKWKPEYEKMGFRLALLGATNDEMAEIFDINPSTLDYWLQHRKRFAEQVRKGKTEADSKVAQSLYKRAIGCSHPDTQVLSNRIVEYDDNGKMTNSHVEPLIVPLIKHYPPDSYACLKWLAMRQKEKWTETQNLNVNYSGSIDITMFQGMLQSAGEITNEELKLAMKLGLDKAVKEQTASSN